MSVVNMNLSLITVGICVACIGLCNGQVLSRGACPKVPVQQNFDLNQYLGRWYEMERFFAIFQLFADCVTAEYTLLDPVAGRVEVNNTGLSTYTKKYFNSIGRAQVMEQLGPYTSPDDVNPAKLGVTFGDQSPGTYWVLSTDYTSYTVIWSCTETNLKILGTLNTQITWILTRSPDGISSSKREELIEMLQKYNIETKHFSKTKQRDCPFR
ncbi:hypothetical protein ACF0H5_007174 [Mactra antiquata]